MVRVRASVQAHRHDVSHKSGQKQDRLAMTCCLRICFRHLKCCISGRKAVLRLEREAAGDRNARQVNKQLAHPTACGQLSTDFQRISAFHREWGSTLGLDHRPETFWQNACALYACSASGAVLVRAPAHRVCPRKGFRDRHSKLSGSGFRQELP